MDAFNTEFKAEVERIAGCPVSDPTLSLLRLATHLGTASAAERNVELRANAHWSSLLGALLLSDEPAGRWLQWGAGQGWLNAESVLPPRRARAAVLRDFRAGSPPPIGPDGWFTLSSQAQIREAAQLVPNREDEHSEAVGQEFAFRISHLMASLVLLPTGAHGEALLKMAPSADLTPLRRHVACWVADVADIFVRSAPEHLIVDRLLDDSIFIRLSPALIAATTLPDPNSIPEYAAMSREERRYFQLWRGPLSRVAMAQSPTNSDPDWPELLAIAQDACSGGLGPGVGRKRPAFRPVPLTGRGHTIFARAAALAARTSKSPSLPVDLRHLIGAAIAPEDDALPPAVSSGIVNFKREERISTLAPRLLNTIKRHRLETDDLSAWADFVLGQRLVTARIPNDLTPKGDLLDFRRYADAFASIIADIEVKTPLAIGLFGPWGTGKSTMMGMIDAALEQIEQRAKIDATPRFCRGIVRVTFNAWHYAETTLWASLFVRILEELSRHLNQTAVERPDAKRAQALLDLNEALVTLQRAEAAVAAAENTASTAAARAVEATSSEVAAREAAAAAAEARIREAEAAAAATASRREAIAVASDAVSLLTTLGFATTAELAGVSGEELVTQLTGLKDELSKAKRQVSELKKPWTRLTTILGWEERTRLHLVLTASIVAVVCVGVFVGFHFGVFEAITGSLLTMLAGASWIFSQIAPLWRQTQDAIAKAPAIIGRLADAAEEVKRRGEARDAAEQNKIELVREEEEKRIAADSKAARTEAADRNREAADAQAAASQARAGAEAARQVVADLQATIVALAPERLLAAFVAARANSEDYSKYLGLPTRIRRDLDDLRAHLDAVAATKAESGRADRIVLFIDDLDRCAPDVVIKVLEAVHILLASELFVVVVGVDVRWLRKAVETHHAGQFGGGGPLDAEEFLEKIFQIPFWVPGMDDTQKKALISGALPIFTGQTTASESAFTTTGANSSPGRPGNGAEPSASPLSSGDQNAEQAVLPLPSLEPVQFSEDEQRSLMRWGTLAGDTPRRLKRFARSYMLFRASLPRAQRAAFLDNRDFNAVARLLALNCADPHRWPASATAIADANPDARLESADDSPTAAQMRPWLDQISRFGFASP